MAEMHVHYTPRKALASSSPDASFPILAISILGILTTAILLVSYYVFVIKCCLNWRRSDVINRLASSRSRRQRRHDDDPFMVYAAAAAAERRGVEASVIRAIPIFRFRKGSDVGEQKSGPFQECAVCLSEFEEGERLRRLPGCSHAFHIDCIDMWLQSNANCPLCRSDVTAGVTILPADHVMPQGVHQEARYDGGGEVEVRDGRGDGIRELTLTVEATMQQQQQQEHPMAMMPRKAEQRMAQNEGRGKYHHICSMGDECIDVRWGKDEQFSVQPIRRSFSVDSSRDRLLYLSLQEILQQNPHFYSQEIVSGEGSSSDGVPPAGRIRRSCFSFGRGSRSSVLPMAMDL